MIRLRQAPIQFTAQTTGYATVFKDGPACKFPMFEISPFHPFVSCVPQGGVRDLHEDRNGDDFR